MVASNRKKYIAENRTLPGVQKVEFTADSKTNPTIVNISISAADTEHSYVIPSGTLAYSFRSRNNFPYNLSYTSGQSASNYYRIPAGCSYSEEGISGSASLTLYLQNPKGSDTIELRLWS